MKIVHDASKPSISDVFMGPKVERIKIIKKSRATGSLWVCSCLALSEELENFLVHRYLHWNGFSPV